jgi:hypothetical protein
MDIRVIPGSARKGDILPISTQLGVDLLRFIAMRRAVPNRRRLKYHAVMNRTRSSVERHRETSPRDMKFNQIEKHLAT